MFKGIKTFLLSVLAMGSLVAAGSGVMKQEEKVVEAGTSETATLKLSSSTWGSASAYYSIHYWNSADDLDGGWPGQWFNDGKTARGSVEITAPYDTKATNFIIVRWNGSDKTNEWGRWEGKTSTKANYFTNTGWEQITASWKDSGVVVEPGKQNWGLVGDPNPDGWAADSPKKFTWNAEKSRYELIIGLKVGQNFKILQDNSWGSEKNWNDVTGKTGVSTYLTAGTSDNNISVKTAGKYLIYFGEDFKSFGIEIAVATEYTFQYYVDGSRVGQSTILEGESFSQYFPTGRAGYHFRGWYLDEQMERPLAVGTPISEDMADSNNVIKLYTKLAKGVVVGKATDTFTLYVKVDSSLKWSSASVHRFTENGDITTWPGTVMKKVDDDIYSFDFSYQKDEKVIFHSTSTDSQTGNIILEDLKGLFDYSEDSEGNLIVDASHKLLNIKGTNDYSIEEGFYAPTSDGNNLDVYAQTTEEPKEDGTFDLRFWGTLVNPDAKVYSSVGFNITVDYNGQNASDTVTLFTVYDEVSYNGGTLKKDDYRANYFFCFTMTDVPQGAKFTVTPVAKIVDGDLVSGTPKQFEVTSTGIKLA